MLWGRSSATADTEGKLILFFSILNIDNSHVPLPHVEGVADVEEFFLPMEFQFVQSLRSVLPAEAIEFLAVDPDDVTKIADPAQDREQDIVELGKWHVIGYGDQPDHHGIYLPENGAHNQTLAGMCIAHLHSLVLIDPRPSVALHSAQIAKGIGLGLWRAINEFQSERRVYPEQRLRPATTLQNRHSRQKGLDEYSSNVRSAELR